MPVRKANAQDLLVLSQAAEVQRKSVRRMTIEDLAAMGEAVAGPEPRGLASQLPSLGSVARHTARGALVELPALPATMLGMAGDVGLAGYKALTGETPGQTYGPETPGFAQQLGGAATGFFEDVAEEVLPFDLPRPETAGGEIAQAGGLGAAMGGLSAFGAATPVGRILHVLGGGVLGAAGEKTRQMAEEAGAGTAGQVAAGMAPDVAVAVGAMLGRNIPRAFAALRNMTKSISPEAKRLGQKLGATTRQTREAAARIKNLIPEGSEDDWIRITDEVISTLEAGENPTLFMAIQAHQDAGSSIAALEKVLARDIPEAAQRLGGARIEMVKSLKRRYKALESVNEEGIDAATRSYRTLRDRDWVDQRAAWDVIPEEQLPGMDIRPIKEAAEVSAKLGLEHEVADAVHRFRELPDELPWDEWQKQRSTVLREGRSRAAEDSTAEAKRKHLFPIRNAMQEQLDVLVASSDAGTAYGTALRKTQKFYNDFDVSKKVIDALENTEGVGVWKSLTNPGVKNPVEDAAHVASLLRQLPEGLKGLQRAGMDEVLGAKFTEWDVTRINAAATRFGAQRKVLKEILEPEQFEALQKLITDARIARTGPAGLSGQMAATGSAWPSFLNTVMGGPGDQARFLARSMGGVWDKVKAAVGSPSSKMRNKIMLEAVVDVRAGNMLLKVPTAANVDAWLVNWRQLNAAAVRAGEREGGAQKISDKFARDMLVRETGRDRESFSRQEVSDRLKQMSPGR